MFLAVSANIKQEWAASGPYLWLTIFPTSSVPTLNARRVESFRVEKMRPAEVKMRSAEIKRLSVVLIRPGSSGAAKLGIGEGD
jgi:hypothetical protein